MIDIANHLVKLVVQLAYLDVAHVLGAVTTIETNLRSKHRQRLVGTNAAVLHNARLRVETRGNIGGNDKRRQFVYGWNPNAKRRTGRAVKARPQNGIDDHVRLLAKLHQLIARRANDHVNVTTSGAASDMTCKGTWNLTRIDRRDNIDMDIFLLKNIRSNPTVTAVVAKTGQHEHTAWMLGFDNRSEKLSRVLHELCLRSALALDNVFESSNFLDVQNRLHLALLILKSLIAALDALKLVENRARFPKRLRDALFFILCGLFCPGARLLGQGHGIGDGKIARCRKRERKLNNAALLRQLFCPTGQKNSRPAVLPSRNRNILAANALKARAQRLEHRLAGSKAASILSHGTRGGFAKLNFLGRENASEEPRRNLADTLHARNLNNIDADAGFCHHDPLWQSNRTICLLYPLKRSYGVGIQE